MLSKEWTKWYLTDKGWVRGEQRCDTGIENGSEPNVSYYKIVIYKEEISSPFKIYQDFEEEIIDKKTSTILETKFGKAPRTL